MTTTVDDADSVYRIATYVPIADFTFCHYLVVGDEALLFHTGPRQFAEVTVQTSFSVVPLERLRWVSWGHVENDAAEHIFAAAPNAQGTVGEIGGC